MTPLLGAFVLCLACHATVDAQRGRGESGFEWTKRLAAGSTITIRNGDGFIHVGESSSDLVEVRATKTRLRAAQNDVAFDVDESRGGALICTLYDRQRSCGERSRSSRNTSLRVEYTVLVPRDIRVDVSTGRGEISVERVGSAVTASTGIGRVFVTTERGPVNVSTGSGDVDVRIQSSPADADVTVTTGSGLIRVAVPTGFNGEVDARSENGTLRTDFEITILGRIDAHQIRGTIGRGRARIRLQTGNGRIELRKS
jgi:DUF4097 and DUF4098 domain-containing protein YvlB